MGSRRAWRLQLEPLPPRDDADTQKPETSAHAVDEPLTGVKRERPLQQVADGVITEFGLDEFFQ